MRLWICGLLVVLADTGMTRAADDAPEKTLPKVVLIGDSIRLSYAPVVAKQLAGKANVVSPKPNGGDSSNVLKHIEEWAVREQPAIVHFNCGIHDTKKFKSTGKFQVSPEQYEANLRAIVAAIRKGTKAKVFFALTTPIVDDRAAKTRAERDYGLHNASTEQYNEIAQRVMKELDVPVNDLRAALGTPAEQAAKIVDDGVHLNKQGVEKLGAAVATFVAQHLPAAK
ncbi:GDSL-like Lipase/Acylhydrolase [Anatilimnocola aggregata]|uniref:GDSL-like Lipase/Acylhydrolase n=1 Tax=Anatilimnocola aggregata TaxID=2528021 RepID=A0A517YBH6_9BACT|nr:GDSL-type esterase/lipase family protein [Anatilimnocola aggregata]QDU27529.1 GDSL-like Lipase/Acylhydrolase [Anatilimnocola aggregata]